MLILRCVPPINGLVCFHLSSLLASTQSLASFNNASFVVKLASSFYVKTLISARLRRPRNLFLILCVGSIVCVSGLNCLSLIFSSNLTLIGVSFVIFGIPNRMPKITCFVQIG